MEGTATVEQAEPQSSAAPGQDTSAPATGDNGPASPASFGSRFRQRVFERADREQGRVGVSSAGSERTRPDEQPAPSGAAASRPGAADPDGDGPAGVEAGSPASTDQPRLSRAQRKALKAGQSAGEDTPTASGDTSSTSVVDDDDDPVIARVTQTVNEGISRLEGLIRPPQPVSESAPADEETVLFGSDEEFNRRAEIALHGSQRGQYLDSEEQDELAIWASNRKARGFADGRARTQERSQFSAAILAAAGEFGIDAATLQKPGTTVRDIFGAFVSHGEAKQAEALTAANDRIAKLEAANKLLADENDAMLGRAPGTARSLLRGGDGAVSRGAQLANRSQMNGRQLMQAGMQQRAAPGRRNRPGAR